MTDIGTHGDLRIGIDVGGTNTDAVVLDETDTILATTKVPTTADVTGGIRRALDTVLATLGDRRAGVGRIMLGTTHATNAILERRGLGRVAVLRLGAPATREIPPLEGWPTDLRQVVEADTAIVGGGHLVDGFPIGPLDRDAINRFLDGCAGRVDALAVTGVFSPAFRDQELEVGVLARERLGEDVAVSMSHEIGSLGLLERENATVLNAALYGVARHVTGALDEAVAEHGLEVTCYFAQNDGTLMNVDAAARYPVLTIGSGPANSIRGAAYLSGVGDAVVVDVGGTSSDFGVLVNGFPRESALAVDIGGVRTNFRMPDLLGIALGGGTRISGTPADPHVGPDSVGYRITEAALAFGGTVPTLTDAALAAGTTTIATASRPDPTDAVTTLLAAGLTRAERHLADAFDRVALGREQQVLVAVGGGAFLVPDRLPGAGQVLRPAHADVANAVGAAIALASGRWETIATLGEGRAAALAQAREVARRRAVQAGADAAKVEIVEISEIPLSYLTEPAVRIQVKAAGPLSHH